jgi:NAD(P)-dependent dehydrogenase (short-subunit alcohol dehydrogenase family)
VAGQYVQRPLAVDTDAPLTLAAFRTNVTANFFVAAAFVPLLHAAKNSPSKHSGNVINISSLSGLTRRSQNGQFSYNVSFPTSSLSSIPALTR